MRRSDKSDSLPRSNSREESLNRAMWYGPSLRVTLTGALVIISPAPLSISRCEPVKLEVWCNKHTEGICEPAQSFLGLKSCRNSGHRRRQLVVDDRVYCSPRRSHIVRRGLPSTCQSKTSEMGKNVIRARNLSLTYKRREKRTLILRLLELLCPLRRSCLRNSLFSRSSFSNSFWYLSCTFINSSCIFSIFCCMFSAIDQDCQSMFCWRVACPWKYLFSSFLLGVSRFQ